MALILALLKSAARDRPPRAAPRFANGGFNMGICGLGRSGRGRSPIRVGYPAVFLVAGVVTTATAGLLVPSRRSRSPASASST
jgi:hypothetical protein